MHVTTSSEEEARRIGRILVEERLAACVNILGQVHSIFRWENEIQEEQEFAFIAKTFEGKAEAFTKRTIELHSHDCPCIVKTPITGGNADFLTWIEEETR
ncbi:MAG: divalent-cation tolerance protein CutA [Alphaproteobacteria bacterium]|nr:divalent-cation tolerance protein CutA [Alphaproteobacteria bacterium]